MIALAFFGQPAPAEAAPGGGVKIASANIGGSAFDNSTDIIEFVDAQKPDVLLLIELTPATLATFGDFKSDSLNLTLLGEKNRAAVQLMDRAGWR